LARVKRPGQKPDVEWDFFSFPVLFAVAASAFVTVLLYQFLAPILFVVSLFGLSFCTAHMLSRWFRNRTVGKRIEKAEEEERERRALAARAANAQAGEAASNAARKRRRRRA
jgi:hypothetical protein